MRKQFLLSVALSAAVAGAVLMLPSRGMAGSRGGGGAGGRGAGFGMARSGARLNRANFPYYLAFFNLRRAYQSPYYGYGYGYGYSGGYQWPGYWGPGAYSDLDYAAYSYAPAPVYSAPPPPTVPSYAAAWEKSAPAPRSAEIDVRLPAADAKMWVDGKLTEQTGANRRFNTSELAAGVFQSVEIRIEWTEGNRKLERTRVIEVKGGRQYYTDLEIADRESSTASK